MTHFIVAESIEVLCSKRLVRAANMRYTPLHATTRKTDDEGILSGEIGEIQDAIVQKFSRRSYKRGTDDVEGRPVRICSGREGADTGGYKDSRRKMVGNLKEKGFFFVAKEKIQKKT